MTSHSLKQGDAPRVKKGSAIHTSDRLVFIVDIHQVDIDNLSFEAIQSAGCVDLTVLMVEVPNRCAGVGTSI